VDRGGHALCTAWRREMSRRGVKKMVLRVCTAVRQFCHERPARRSR
jgi:hypothetical protein